MDDPKADPWPARIQGGIPRRELPQPLVQILYVLLPQELQWRLGICHTGALEVAVHSGNLLLQCMLLCAGVGDPAILDHLASRGDPWHRSIRCSTLNWSSPSHGPSWPPRSVCCQHMKESEVHRQHLASLFGQTAQSSTAPIKLLCNLFQPCHGNANLAFRRGR